MTTTLSFQGTVTVPAQSNCGPCPAPPGFELELDELVAEFEEVLLGQFQLESVGYFQPLEAVKQLEVLEFLAISLAEGQTADVEILLGRPPLLLGQGGVFPLVGSAAFVFELRSMAVLGGTVAYTISAALQAGDTASVAAQRINAAAILAGVPGLVATVTGGQLELSGVSPGAGEGLNVTTANAGAGFPTTGLCVGAGSSYLCDRSFEISLAATAGWTGEDVWVRGGAALLHFVAAGS